MKTVKYILGAAVAVSMVACNFFDSASPSAVDGSVVFSSADSTEMVIAAVYEQFGNDRSYRNRLSCGYQGVNTDVEHCTKNSGKAEWALYNMTTTNSDLSQAGGKDPWGYFNNAIEKCNNIIEGVETYGDKSEKSNYLLGEAYFLRSFCYLEMVKYWGDVPARFTSLNKEPAGMNMPKEDRTAVLEHLRGDLKRAAELMPWSAECPGTAQNFVGRPSKAAALALLMRSDMMYAGKGVRPDTWQNGPEFLLADASKRAELYDEVLWAASEIMGNAQEMAKFQKNYEDIFRKVCADETNYYNTEVLWEIPFADGSRGQVLQYNCPKMSDAVGGLKNNVSGSSNSTVGIVPTLYYDYEEDDVRRDVTMQPTIWVYDDGTKYNSDASKVALAFPEREGNEKILYQKQQSVADWYAAKYRVEWMTRERNGNDDGVDFPIIRLADVLLMAAEATIGGVGGDVPANLHGVNGQDCLDKVRARAHASNKRLSMEAIQEERKLEFTGEYLRKYDLMRWGNLHIVMKDAKARLELMDKHEGEFAGLQDTLYFKYKRCDDFSMPGVKGFVIDSVYGMKKGELGTPSYYNSENGWVKTCVYESSSGRQLADFNFMLYNYDEEECLLGRQYWPIFSANVGASNGTLWNDYMYK